jgi:hypothetical protein
VPRFSVGRCVKVQSLRRSPGVPIRWLLGPVKAGRIQLLQGLRSRETAGQYQVGEFLLAYQGIKSGAGGQMWAPKVWFLCKGIGTSS